MLKPVHPVCDFPQPIILSRAGNSHTCYELCPSLALMITRPLPSMQQTSSTTSPSSNNPSCLSCTLSIKIQCNRGTADQCRAAVSHVVAHLPSATYHPLSRRKLPHMLRVVPLPGPHDHTTTAKHATDKLHHLTKLEQSIMPLVYTIN